MFGLNQSVRRNGDHVNGYVRIVVFGKNYENDLSDVLCVSISNKVHQNLREYCSKWITGYVKKHVSDKKDDEESDDYSEDEGLICDLCGNVHYDTYSEYYCGACQWVRFGTRDDGSVILPIYGPRRSHTYELIEIASSKRVGNERLVLIDEVV